MRYPNTRYGNLTELRYYTQGLSAKQIAKQLKRSEKSVTEWLNGNRKIPFWVPELLRLRHMEADLRMRQMGFGERKRRLGIVNGSVIDFPPPKKPGKYAESVRSYKDGFRYGKDNSLASRTPESRFFSRN